MSRMPRNLLKAIFILLFISFATRGMAQDAESAKLQRELYSSWLVTITGEARNRAVQIVSADKKSDGVWSLIAKYGWSDGTLTPVKADLFATPGGYRLELVTQANSVIVGESSDLKIFTGTFKPASGTAKTATIEKMSIEAMGSIAKQTTNLAISKIAPPSPDVPAACAGFVGPWTGVWSIGDAGRQWLWVSEVDANCSAKIAYLDSLRVPSGYGKAQISDGVLSFVCNRSTGGTCNFEQVGNDLWANYSNSGGGRNSAVFKKIAADGK